MSRRRRTQELEGHHILQSRLDRVEEVLNVTSASRPRDFRFTTPMTSSEQQHPSNVQSCEDSGDRGQTGVLSGRRDISASTINTQMQAPDHPETLTSTVFSNVSGHLTLSSSCTNAETGLPTPGSRTSEGRRWAQSPSGSYTPDDHPTDKAESIESPQNVRTYEVAL